MTIIDADKFLGYLIISKHIDGLTCGEVKQAVEMCKVDVLDKIRGEIVGKIQEINFKGLDSYEKAQAEMRLSTLNGILQIIDKYRKEQTEE